MKSLFAAAFCSTSAVTLAGFAMVASAEALVVQGIGADTPIDGITLGVLLVALLAAGGLLFQGGRQIFRLGGELVKWRAALKQASEVMASLARVVERLDEMDKRHERFERWRVQVDPLLTDLQVRLGVGRKSVGDESERGGRSA